MFIQWFEWASYIVYFIFFCFASQKVGASTATQQLEQDASYLSAIERQYCTQTYRKAALNILLNEANELNNALHLASAGSITWKDLIETHIEPPYMATHAGAFGSISIDRYTFSALKGNKLCHITRHFTDGERGRVNDFKRMMGRYLQPIAQIDTNLAYRQALCFLKAIGTDVFLLTNHTYVDIEAITSGNQFLPLYKVRWFQRKWEVDAAMNLSRDVRTVAIVEWFAPENELLNLHVNNPNLIKRKSLSVLNWNKLIQESDDTNANIMWKLSAEYETSASNNIVCEVRRVCQQLQLTNVIPELACSNQTVLVEPVYFSRATGKYGALFTHDYVFGAYLDNKLSYVHRHYRPQDEEDYIDWLGVNYLSPIRMISTNTAYSNAKAVLKRFDVDIDLLQRECNVEVRCPKMGSKFVPLYTISWRGPDAKPCAIVQITEPQNSLEKIWILSSKYIKRNSL